MVAVSWGWWKHGHVSLFLLSIRALPADHDCQKSTVDYELTRRVAACTEAYWKTMPPKALIQKIALSCSATQKESEQHCKSCQLKHYIDYGKTNKQSSSLVGLMSKLTTCVASTTIDARTSMEDMVADHGICTISWTCTGLVSGYLLMQPS